MVKVAPLILRSVLLRATTARWLTIGTNEGRGGSRGVGDPNGLAYAARLLKGGVNGAARGGSRCDSLGMHAPGIRRLFWSPDAMRLRSQA